MDGYKDIAHYPVVISEKVRLSDTDRQGHVNNVSFSFLFEAGRSAVVLETHDLLDPGCFFVIVATSIEFLGELNWPGHVEIANGVEKVGNSSITVRQALFQDGQCAATSNSTMVQVNIARKANQPLSERAKALLATMRYRSEAT